MEIIWHNKTKMSVWKTGYNSLLNCFYVRLGKRAVSFWFN